MLMLCVKILDIQENIMKKPEKKATVQFYTTEKRKQKAQRMANKKYDGNLTMYFNMLVEQDK